MPGGASRETEFEQVFQLLSSANLATLAVACLLYLGFFVFKAQRWQTLLSVHVNLRSTQLFPYVMLGYGGNVLLPMQLGEAGRGVLLARHQQLSATLVLSGIAAEKLFDLFAVTGFALLALGQLTLVSQDLLSSVFIVLSLLILCGLTLYWLLRPGNSLLAKLDELNGAGRLPGLMNQLSQAVAGVGALREKSFTVLFWTLGMWLCMLSALFCVCWAIQLPITWPVAILALFLSAVGLMLPTGPGFVGTIQAAFVLAMLPLGIEREGALAASLLYNLLITLPPLLLAAGSAFWLSRKYAGTA